MLTSLRPFASFAVCPGQIVASGNRFRFLRDALGAAYDPMLVLAHSCVDQSCRTASLTRWLEQWDCIHYKSWSSAVLEQS